MSMSIDQFEKKILGKVNNKRMCYSTCDEVSFYIEDFLQEGVVVSFFDRENSLVGGHFYINIINAEERHMSLWMANDLDMFASIGMIFSRRKSTTAKSYQWKNRYPNKQTMINITKAIEESYASRNKVFDVSDVMPCGNCGHMNIKHIQIERKWQGPYWCDKCSASSGKLSIDFDKKVFDLDSKNKLGAILHGAFK